MTTKEVMVYEQIKKDILNNEFKPGTVLVERKLTEKYQDQIEILAGSGIKAHNVKDFIEKTKIRQVHSSAKCWCQDLTTTANHVSYAYHEAFDYDAVSEEAVKELMNAVK